MPAAERLLEVVVQPAGARLQEQMRSALRPEPPVSSALRITMRLTVMLQAAKGLEETNREGEEEYPLRQPVVETLERIKWYLWHGNVFQVMRSSASRRALTRTGAVSAAAGPTMPSAATADPRKNMMSKRSAWSATSTSRPPVGSLADPGTQLGHLGLALLKQPRHPGGGRAQALLPQRCPFGVG